MLGISADTPEKQKKFKTKYELPYTLLADTDKKVCQAFGVLKETHPIAMKVGRPVMRQVVSQARGHVVSDCPLAAKHIMQGAREIADRDGVALPARAPEHPIELFARAYGLV